MISTSFHIADAASIIAAYDKAAANYFSRALHSRRYLLAEALRDSLNKQGLPGDNVYDRVFARLEMHSEIMKDIAHV